MLKGIPANLPPQLVKVLLEMGHGDTICLGDANFPHASLHERLIRCDGQSMVALLDSILTLMPLDTYVPCPVTLMQVLPDDPVETPIWQDYEQIVAAHDARGAAAIENIERFSFYDRARQCYAGVASGETALYANLILQKGVLTPEK